MIRALRSSVLATLLLCLSQPAAAQYIRITTDNPVDNTRLRQTGIQNILTITLNTNHDRDGSLQTCNSHSGANCGGPTSNAPLTLFSYQVYLRAVGGTVTWGTFTPDTSAFQTLQPQVQDNQDVEFTFARPPGTSSPPGFSSLGKIPVTITSGSPAIVFATFADPRPLDPFGYGTLFGTNCDASALGNSYVLGDIDDPCGVTSGLPPDFYDADGASAPSSGEATPVITAPATASGAEGTLLSITATATDADATTNLTITVTGLPPWAGPAVFPPGTSPVSRTVTGTPGFNDAGNYVIQWHVVNGHGLSSSTGTSITIANTNRPPLLNPISNMVVCEGSIADQAISGADPDGDALTFSKATGPTYVTITTTSSTTGNIRVAPGFTDAGTSFATARASDGSLASDRTFTITVTNGCRPPVLGPIANMTVMEGQTADQAISAVSPDGAALFFSKVSGPPFMSVTTISPGTGSATGNVHLAPTLSDAGTYSVTVSVSDGAFSSARIFTITVTPGANQCPTANPDGPYSGLVNVPVVFDGTGSSDPDGDPLTYLWDFGDGTTGSGATPSHIYTALGNYSIMLTVTDIVASGACSGTAMTVATIADACLATVFNGYDTIRLGSGKPFWFAYVQPATGCYVNSDVNVSSFVLKYAGRQISVNPAKTTVGGDKSGDGIDEIRVSFSKADLRTLFTGTGLGNGHNLVTVTIEGTLVTGGRIAGSTQVDVVNNGSFSAPTVAPNPLNPEAALTYTTTRQGFVRIGLFDIHGRMVRTLVDEPAMAAGTHVARIDGEKLPSGVYFIRGASGEGVFTHTITILK